FFFSSRRRHTRFSRDWSSDVYSSDLDRLSGGQDRLSRGQDEDPGGQGDDSGGQGRFRVGALDLAPDGISTRTSSCRPTRPSKRQIGRASCRERVQVAVGALTLK